MATTAELLQSPLDLYRSASFEPDAEFVDGEILERPMGEWSHANWQAAILDFFRSRRFDWRIRAAAELRVQVKESNFRVPDVVVLDRNLPIEQVITHPPLAVFEILSPEDSLSRLLSKLRDYEGMGIATILVLDPLGEHYRFRQGTLAPLSAEPFELPGSVCRFDLAEIVKLLD
jgi:Uma2 family endonuclease